MSFTRPASSSIPDAPGAYLFRDEEGRVIYVGKASSLRKRLASYWSRPLHPRTEAMVDAAASVEWIVASGEVDALMLEFNLIQRHRPRFNVRYRDDKSYPYLALTVGERWPRAQVLRGAKRKHVRYFGPYGHAWAIRDTLDALTRVFPIRTCTNAFFDQRARARRPCLYYDIGRCSGPCVPEVTGITEEAYRDDVDALGDFLAGNSKPVLKRLEVEMGAASSREEYERAARFRDQLQAARRALESQEMVLTQPEDLDVVGLAEDDLEAAFQVFAVRGGRVLGRKGWVVDRVEDLDTPGLLASFLRQLYMERQDVPPRVLVPTAPADREVLEAWLTERRGSRVRIGVAERGAKRKLAEVVGRNAAEAFHRHKLRRASDFGARSRALSELADRLGLEQAPLRIECYDISNLGPTDTVGSMVVFEDGLPKRSDYRRFGIKSVAGQDDVGHMEEMLRRRFTRYLEERAEPPGSRKRFSYPPALIVIDGGRGQLGACTRVLEEVGLHIPHVGLAKRLEEVYFPHRPDPLQIPRGSEALFVLQHIRDEAHRFAITFHRRRREKRALAS
ncbi:MAG TPA: excinuclease ABC subunit UvrC, partial [Actinomycetota bacterium]|nr:excinuclease ABC subunit UvrC [Actinomycetota bacterium]